MPPIMRFRCTSKLVLLILSNMYFLSIEPALQLRFDIAARLLVRSLEVGKIEAAETRARAAAIMASTANADQEHAAGQAQDATSSIKSSPAEGIMKCNVANAEVFNTIDMCEKIGQLKASMEEDEEDWELLHDLVLMLRMCESFCGRKRGEKIEPVALKAYYSGLENAINNLDARFKGYAPEIAKYTELVGSFKGQIANLAAAADVPKS